MAQNTNEEIEIESDQILCVYCQGSRVKAVYFILVEIDANIPLTVETLRTKAATVPQISPPKMVYCLDCSEQFSLIGV